MTRGRAAHPTLRAAGLWIGLAATVVFAYLAVRGVRFSTVWDAIRRSDGRWLVPALLTLAVAVAMRAVRWRTLFAPATRPPIGAVTEAMLIGYLFNNILPARAGEAARIVALHRRSGTSRTEVAATVVVERAYDVLALLVLLFAGLPWLPQVASLRVAGALAAVLAAGLAGVVVALAVGGERPVLWALRPLHRLPGLHPERIEYAAHNLVVGLAGLRRARLALAAFGWTLASWLVLAVSSWCVLEEFGFGLSLAAGLLVVIATGLSMVIPSAPAAVGVFEAATVVALRAYHVPHADALSFAIVLHAVNVLPYIAAGLVALRTQVRVGAVAQP